MAACCADIPKSVYAFCLCAYTYTHNSLPSPLSLPLARSVSRSLSLYLPPISLRLLLFSGCRCAAQWKETGPEQEKDKEKMLKLNRLIRDIELAVQAGLLLRLSNLIPKIFQANCKATKVFVAEELGLEGAGCPFAKTMPKTSVPGVLRPLRCGTRSCAAVIL